MGAPAGAAHRELEGPGARIVLGERAQVVAERQPVGPIQPEGTSDVMQTAQLSVVDTLHRAEQAGPRREQPVGDRQVGRQRQRCAPPFDLPPWPEAQLESRRRPDHFLLGCIDAVGLAGGLGPLDAAGQLGKRRREVGQRHGRVRQLRSAPDDRTLDVGENGEAVGADPDTENDRGTVDVGQQARRIVGQALSGTGWPGHRGGRW